MIKVFSKPLSALLSLNDRIQQYCGITPDTGFRTCLGCGVQKASGSMFKCARCNTFWFCSKDCSQTGWTEKGHKDDCSLLGNPDIRVLFEFDWGVFDGVVSFPLTVGGLSNVDSAREGIEHLGI